jgi:hypothetical protein
LAAEGYLRGDYKPVAFDSLTGILHQSLLGSKIYSNLKMKIASFPGINSD